jgi:hypothetical protein
MKEKEETPIEEIMELCKQKISIGQKTIDTQALYDWLETKLLKKETELLERSSKTILLPIEYKDRLPSEKKMKEKLITDGNNNYSLLDSNNDLIGTTMESMITNHKLSLKNCQAVANGYDLENMSDFYGSKAKGSVDFKLGANQGFEDGFQKALEILGDKKIVTYIKEEQPNQIETTTSISYKKCIKIRYNYRILNECEVI